MRDQIDIGVPKKDLLDHLQDKSETDKLLDFKSMPGFSSEALAVDYRNACALLIEGEGVNIPLDGDIDAELVSLSR